MTTPISNPNLDRLLRLKEEGIYDLEPDRDLPETIGMRNPFRSSGRERYGLKIEVSDSGKPTIHSETDLIDPRGLFEWLLDKEVYTSLDNRGSFDSIFRVLDSKQMEELAVIGKTSYNGITLTMPGHISWLGVNRGSHWGRLSNLSLLFRDSAEFGLLTDPSHFTKAADLAHIRFTNAGLGDVDIRSPGRMIESLTIRKVRPSQPKPGSPHVERFASAFKPARVEGNIFGRNEVRDYDISSAFPSAIAQLVDLNQIYWMDTPKIQDEAVYAAVKCDIYINDHLIRGPISVRFGGNSSFFPIGSIPNIWLSKPEVDLLREYPELGRIVKIHEASWGILIDHSQKLHYPFKSLMRDDLYALRKSTPYLSSFIKLGMAALWGKFISVYKVQNSLDKDDYYTRSSCLYNPVFGSHVTGIIRASLYRSSLGKEVIGEFVDGVALIESVRMREGFGGFVEEGSGSMVLFDDQNKGCDWKSPELLEWARGYHNHYRMEVPRTYRGSLPFTYGKYGGKGVREIGKLNSVLQPLKLGPSRRLMADYKVGEYLEYSLPSSPPRVEDLMSILMTRMG